jgi:hypothetical protein
MYFSRGFFVYSPPPVHVYIRALGPQINTSAIHNIRIYEINYTITYGIFFLSSTIMFLPVTWNPLHSHVTNRFTRKQKKIYRMPKTSKHGLYICIICTKPKLLQYTISKYLGKKH